MNNSTPAPDTGNGNGQLKALRWVSTLLAASIVITALLIGQAIFKGSSSAVSVDDHGYFGNVIFVLAVIQIALAFLCWQKNTISRNQLVIAALVLIALFAQIGLGYMGHRSGMKEATVFHFGLGVLSMGLVTINATLSWVRPRQEPLGA